MKENVALFLKGSAGIAATEIVEQASMLDPAQITSTANIIIQIIISVVTLFGMFKKKKQ